MLIKEVVLNFGWRLSAHCKTGSSVKNDEKKMGAEAADTR